MPPGLHFCPGQASIHLTVLEILDPPSPSQLIIVGGAEQSANHIPWPQ